MKQLSLFATSLLLALLVTTCAAFADDPLPSWRNGATKDSIIQFVERVTQKDSPDFVRVEDRIATFDNDGTLWCEQPFYTQGFFVVDRIKAQSPNHPEWKDQEPFLSILEGEFHRALEGGHEAVAKLLMVTHAGMSTDEFEGLVKEWIATAENPRFKRRFIDLTYQPMLELLVYLRANDFKTYIVSGGGIDFMRPWTQSTYGIPPEQVIGSTIKTQFLLRDGKPELLRLAAIDFVDDGNGKAICIEKFIGRRPIAAFGNSDGDLEMLQWTTGGSGPRFGLIVHHTDAEREVAYDRHSLVGRLDKALDLAPKNGWTVVDMKRDWAVIFPKDAKKE